MLKCYIGKQCITLIEKVVGVAIVILKIKHLSARLMILKDITDRNRDVIIEIQLYHGMLFYVDVDFSEIIDWTIGQ